MQDEANEGTPRPRINLFLYKGKFSSGKKVEAGGDLFEDYLLTYHEEDFIPIRERFNKNRKSSFDQIMINYLLSIGLQNEECLDILAVWQTLIDFNGGILSHGPDKTIERVRIYHSRELPPFKDIRITNFENKELLECTEIAVITNDLLSYAGYNSFFADGVTYPQPDNPDGHNFVIIRSKTDPTKYIFIDNSFHALSPKNNQNPQIRLPFCSILSSNQIISLEDGDNIICSFLGQDHVYRIGLPYWS